MLKALRLTIGFAVLLLTLVITVPVFLVLYALEKEPLVGQLPPIDYEAITTSKALLKRIVSQIESADAQAATLKVTERELRHLVQVSSRAFWRLNADLCFEKTSIKYRVSLQLAPNPVGEYVNLVFQIGESNRALVVDQFSIGSLAYPGQWMFPLAASLVDFVLKGQQAKLLLNSIIGFRLEADSALIRVLPSVVIKEQLKQAFDSLQETRFPPEEQARILHYYHLLAKNGTQGHYRGRSFSDYLTPLMREAIYRRERSSAIAENRAVIWALAVYFSYGALEALMGNFVSKQYPLVRPVSGVTLGNRGDLMAHFLYSAGIALATQQEIGIAAGEFKELLDSGSGSGFSFADLAADRAGIRFVAAAISNELTARQFQQRLVANPVEAAFFPDMTGLQEGLSDTQFRQNYKDIRSGRYRLEVALIDQRIERLSAYQSNISDK